MPIGVLIVDDSAFMRRELTRLFTEHPDFDVLGTAINGADGLRKAKELKPDLVTLDVEMPEMSGLQALPLILRATTPSPKVMMCSSLTKEGSRESLKALRLGATDVIAKEGSSITGVPSDPLTGIVPRVRALFPKTLPKSFAEAHQQASPAKADDTFGERELTRWASDASDLKLIVVGSSTGGPPALEKFLCALPSSFPLPVVIAQHMPGTFTESLAERLDQVSPLKIVHATDRLPLMRGVGYVIEGGREGKIDARRSGLDLVVGEPSPESRYRPSVDVLFASAAKACGSKAAAVQLTGMGDDGARGAADLADAGAVIACQSESSCVVWGMPRAIQVAGHAKAALAPAKIGEALAHLPARAAAA